ncbi:MAG: DNRLRE domain-containing protein [Clostridiales bacterium]|nr:DNRLRE domain-containing protein [Clostridiales bacterium]
MLGTLFAVDSAGDYTEDLEYRIIEGTDGTKLEVSLSSEYMEKPGRAYPVLIDPTITGTNVTYDSYVSSNHTSTNYYTSTYLKTGKSDTYHIRRSYIKFDIPLYLYKADVSGASLRLKKRGGVAPITVKARRVTSSWTSSGVTWANKPSTATTGPYFLLESDNWYEANVLNIVKKWTESGITNRGFELCDDTESDMNHWTNFYSSDAESPNKPELSIIYNGKKARVLGVVNSGGHDHTSWLSPARIALNSCKSISNAYYSSGDFSISQINGHLSNSTYNVFISRSHGGVKYYDSGSQKNTYIVLDDNANNYLKYESDDSSGINSIDISNMKLIVFIGCKTGSGGTSGYNLVSVANSQGATTVIGFRDTVNCAKASLWAEKLCNKLKSGKDIYTACNELSSTSDFSNTNLVMSKIVIAGSTDTCLN